MNEVNETLRAIRDEISYHKSKIDSLDKTNKFFDTCVGMADEHIDNVKECISFKKSFHNFKINKLSSHRDELMKKYNITGEKE